MELLSGDAYDKTFQALGLVGAGCYITAYSGLQLRLWQGTSLRYILINLTAASLVLLSLTAKFNLASAIVQITWVCISLFGISRTIYLNSVTRFTDEEGALLSAKFGSMKKIAARRLLNAGLWMDADPGTVIAVEGETIGALYFLADGTAEVSGSGTVIGSCAAPTFIGELTCFDGGPASATVTTTSSARLFRIGTPALVALCQKNAELKVILEHALGEDTRHKLKAANQRLVARAPV